MTNIIENTVKFHKDNLGIRISDTSEIPMPEKIKDNSDPYRVLCSNFDNCEKDTCGGMNEKCFGLPLEPQWKLK